VVLMPDKLQWDRTKRMTWFARLAVLLFLLVQFGLYLNVDRQIYISDLSREETSTSIKFYDQVLTSLEPITVPKLHVYYDYRLYVPGKTGWVTDTTFDLLEYGYIQQNHFDVLVLLEQRILDYLSPNVVGIDPALFARNLQFYHDADHETIQGFHLVFRNSFGLIYVRDELYQKYYSK
jgi:hypothetical protein